MSDDGGGGRTATIAAFLANVGIAAAKFGAWAITGSASMLAEAVHSSADSANQGLLLWGRYRSHRVPSRSHPFGFGRERYFWAFVVAMILFSAGALFALVEGEEKLRVPHELTSYPWSAGVLLVAACLEGFSLRTAVKESRTHKRKDESWAEFVHRTTVPELAVILLEDTGALIGLLLAFIGTTAAEVTGNARFDALGSLGIGVLLAGIAITLAVEMKSLLIGEAAGGQDIEAIRAAIRTEPTAREISDLRTEHLGPDELLVVGDVAFDAATALELEAAMIRTEERIREGVPKVRLIYLRPRVVAE
jgi:cation diffusion facilitator family transporter